MKRHFSTLVLWVSFFWAGPVAQPQPKLIEGAVNFTYMEKSATSVSLVGDFNGWSKDEAFMKNDGYGHWALVRKLTPGIYQYKFLVDGKRYENDPGNPATVENYNKSGMNSVFVLTESNKVLFTATPPQPKSNPNDHYPVRAGTKPVFLNIIWHQHQPLYVNPEKDQLQGPWVRTHATKDYYDMAAILRKYPDIHCTINLTSSLLHQLREYYVNRLRPFVDAKRNRIDVKAFWKKWKGKTDQWIDLALKPAEQFDKADRAFL
ncbi:MAG: hypothetical protein AAB393_17995, partial [Bacteroidota bacterium]